MSPARRTVAVVPFFPYPQNHGDAVRRLLLLKSLRRLGPLVVLAVRRPETTDDEVAALRSELSDVDVHVFATPEAGRQGIRGRFERGVTGVLRRTPPWMIGEFSVPLADALRSTIVATDLVVLVGESAGAYLPIVGACVAVWDKSNVMVASAIDAVLRGASFRERVRALVTLPFTRAFEGRVVASVDSVWVTSEAEKVRLHHHYGTVPVAVVPSAVPLPARFAAQNAGLSYAGGGVVAMWLGTFGYPPNWTGLQRLIRAAQPLLTTGALELVVVGAESTVRQRAWLSRHPSVTVLGYVEDLSTVVDRAHCAVVPVWNGAGIKMKSLTLMSLGVPLVATPTALEGVPQEVAAYLAKTPEDFARVLRSLDAARLDDAAAHAAQTIATYFSASAFDDAVLRAVAAV